MSSMKKRNNKGVTLVELLVSMAVLAILMVAVIGFMTAFINIYRNRKKSRAIQQTAQSIYDNMSDAIMQADVIEIEGYTYNGSGEKTEVDFTLKNGSIANGSTEYATYTNTNTSNLSEFTCDITYDGSKYVQYYVQYYYGWYPDVKVDSFTKTTSNIDRSSVVWRKVPESNKITLTGSDITDYIDYVNIPGKEYYGSDRYLDQSGNWDDAKNMYVQVPASKIKSVTITWNSSGSNPVAGKRSFQYLKTGSVPANLYVTEMRVHYSVPLDWKYAIQTLEDTDGNHNDGDERWSNISGFNFQISSNSSDAYHYLTLSNNSSIIIDHDDVTTTYSFKKNVMTVSSKYKYMYKLDTYSIDDKEYTNLIKYLNIGGKDVPGIIARVDAENQSIELEVHVGNDKESFVSSGIINLKNNNVLMYEE